MKRLSSKLTLLGVVVAFISVCLGADSSPQKVTLFFTGYVMGTYGPCGCTKNPTGGLARRSGYSRQYQSKNASYALHVDLGNYFERLGPRAADINELMIRGLADLPIRVLNLGSDDTFLWDQLAQKDLPTQVISTNLSPSDPSRPLPRRFAVVEIPAHELGLQKTLRIGFLGVSDPRRIKPNSGFLGTDPVEAVDRVMAELAPQVDFVVVMADLARTPGPLEESSPLYRIAQAHSNVCAVLSTEKRFVLHRPEKVNNAMVLSSVERGRYLGQLELSLDPEGRVVAFAPQFIPLKEGLEEDPELLRLQKLLDARFGY